MKEVTETLSNLGQSEPSIERTWGEARAELSTQLGVDDLPEDVSEFIDDLEARDVAGVLLSTLAAGVLVPALYAWWKCSREENKDLRARAARVRVYTQQLAGAEIDPDTYAELLVGESIIDEINEDARKLARNVRLNRLYERMIKAFGALVHLLR